MKGFKQCEKGHYYKEELDACPYCPKQGVSGTSSGLGDKTQLMGSQSNQGDADKTIILGAGSSSAPTQLNQPEQPFAHKRDLSKTYIQGASDHNEPDAPAAPRPTRKIMGWIISYTLDPMGMDYRIYEGNNTIGRDISNTIVILKDTAVSGKHVTILSKNSKFYIKDEMASNGTFLNGSELDIGTPYEIHDGDELRLGKTTTFRFKSAI